MNVGKINGTGEHTLWVDSLPQQVVPHKNRQHEGIMKIKQNLIAFIHYSPSLHDMVLFLGGSSDSLHTFMLWSNSLTFSEWSKNKQRIKSMSRPKLDLPPFFVLQLKR